MRRRTSLTTAACTLAAATLLLTACGGGGGDKKIGAEGSGTPAPAPSASTTTAAPTTSAPAGPTFDFPPDVKVVVDPDTTGDAVKDAILRDQGYGQQAIFLAIAKLDSTIPVFQKYVTGKAAADWAVKIDWGKSHHTTVTGTTAFYNRKVTVTDATTAGVTFCQSERESYDKDTKTGKVATTTPSLDDFTLHTARMRKAADGTWQMTDYRSQDRAKSCER
ncbi:hypothetical protein [Streptomyces sp. NRRL F-5123]|uniref:hypothetical protein n=1 Tax=Streptomyces sp. NRRL F-5123 TaxID=1463856 RepID=UPI0004E12EB6|nr:hypothetical protein [Streptomyces sp. NRRL F-5123]